MNKSEFIALLEQKGLLVDRCITTTVQKIKSDDARYAYLKYIKQNPKRVIVEDIKTGEVVEYPSLYKAGRALGVNSKRLLDNADKIMDDKYKIIVSAMTQSAKISQRACSACGAVCGVLP